MTKQLSITLCSHCYHFDYFYYDYKAECELLKRKIEQDRVGQFPIPEDCPLSTDDSEYNPKVLKKGNIVTLLTSYCEDDDLNCTDRHPCPDCIEMCNQFELSEPVKVKYLNQVGKYNA